MWILWITPKNGVTHKSPQSLGQRKNSVAHNTHSLDYYLLYYILKKYFVSPLTLLYSEGFLLPQKDVIAPPVPNKVIISVPIKVIDNTNPGRREKRKLLQVGQKRLIHQLN